MDAPQLDRQGVGSFARYYPCCYGLLSRPEWRQLPGPTAGGNGRPGQTGGCDRASLKKKCPTVSTAPPGVLPIDPSVPSTPVRPHPASCRGSETVWPPLLVRYPLAGKGLRSK